MKSYIRSTLLLLAGPAIAHAQMAAPPVAAPADSVVSKVLKVIESGNANERGAFIKSAFAANAVTNDSARFDRFLASMHDQGAPFTVSKVERNGPTRAGHSRKRQGAPGCDTDDLYGPQ